MCCGTINKIINGRLRKDTPVFWFLPVCVLRVRFWRVVRLVFEGRGEPREGGSRKYWLRYGFAILDLLWLVWRVWTLRVGTVTWWQGNKIGRTRKKLGWGYCVLVCRSVLCTAMQGAAHFHCSLPASLQLRWPHLLHYQHPLFLLFLCLIYLSTYLSTPLFCSSLWCHFCPSLGPSMPLLILHKAIMASCQLAQSWTAYHLTAFLAGAINITDANTGFPVASSLIPRYL